MYLRAFRLDPPRRLQPVHALHVDVEEHDATFPHIPHIRIKLRARAVFPYLKTMPAGFQQRPQRMDSLTLFPDTELYRMEREGKFTPAGEKERIDLQGNPAESGIFSY